MTEPTPVPARAPLFDRVMLASLVPALFLPILAVVIGIFGSLFREATGSTEGIWALVIAVYMFVLLGSMTLNAWLLLRHPQSLLTAALPRRVSVAVALLEGLLLLWVLLLFVGIDVVSVVLGVTLAVVSIVIFVFALRRALDRGDVAALQHTALPSWGRIVAVVYLALAAVAILFAVVSPFVGAGWTDAGGPLGGPATWLLLVLGLPWSHPLYFVSVLVVFGAPAGAGIVPTLLSLVSVIANVVIVAQLLFSPQRRTAIANWFFKLRKAPEPPVE